MSEEFILKICWYNNWKKKKMTAILSKFTVLSQSSYFIVYFLKLKLTLFYNRVDYYYYYYYYYYSTTTRIFQILLLHSVRERENLLLTLICMSIVYKSYSFEVLNNKSKYLRRVLSFV